MWICPQPDGHILATGRDARGRKQYRYHPRWREVRDGDKFDHLAAFGRVAARAAQGDRRRLAPPGMPREKVLGLVVKLLDDTLIRVGNEEYAADNESFGLTTLKRRHVEVDGPLVVFDFVGKSGARARDLPRGPRRLARIVHQCHELEGQDLFTYRGRRRAGRRHVQRCERLSPRAGRFGRHRQGLPHLGRHGGRQRLRWP